MKSKMMKVLVCAMAVAMLAGCSSNGSSSSATTTTYTGTSSNGFGGDVVVTITVNDETKEILSVESAGAKETEAVELLTLTSWQHRALNLTAFRALQ